MANVLFKLEYTVRELWLDSDHILNFGYGGAHDIQVELRRPSEQDQAKGHNAQNAFCTTTSSFEPSAKVCAFLEKLSDENMRSAWPELPEYFQSFTKGTSRELRDFALRTIEVLRWRSNELGPHNPISTRGLTWSDDGFSWRTLPGEISVRAESRSATRPSEEIRSYVNLIVGAGGDAPVYHDLFREAWYQRHDNPRSAIVIGMAAAEISIKRCISTLVPDANWLAMNLPTPPLVRMLNEYLPKLPVKFDFDGTVKPPPKAVLEDIHKGVTIRNQLSHAGAVSPTGESVEAILQSVHDLLWLLDYYSGSTWALQFLRAETHQSLIAG